MSFKLKLIVITLLIVIQSSISAKEKLIIGVEDDAAPWSLADGTGYANELVKAIYQAVNVDIELDVIPYVRCKKEAIDGTKVGCFNMAKIADLEDDIIFPKTPLFLEYISYFYLKEKPLKALSEREIKKGTIVGTVIGYEYTDTFYELKNGGIIQSDETNSETLNIQKLALGRIDAAILVHNETKSSDFIIKNAGAKGQILKAFTSDTLELHIGFSKKHPLTEFAMEMYEKGIAIIKANGTYKKITQKYVDQQN